MKIRLLPTLALLFTATTASAHDSWVQTNTNVVRVGDIMHCDLMLGNHGNEHRDYKLANKIDVTASTLQILDPDGKKYDLKDWLADTGYTPQEGYWTTKFSPTKPCLYMVAHTFEKVMSYAPVRDVKSAKTFFVVSSSLDRVPQNNPGFDRVLGHALELVPATNPVMPMGPGTPISVRLLYKGKPLSKAHIAFIPRGENLSEGMDSRYERTTDAEGRASFAPKDANYYLVAAHVTEPKESRANYQSTNYSATLTVYVPRICSCCGG